MTPDAAPLYIGRPAPGFYKMRLVRGGPWVPVKIWLGFGADPDGGEPRGMFCTRAMVADREAEPFKTWISCAGHPIEPSEYAYMMALRDHAIRYEPDMPQANPRKPIDWNKLTFDF